VSEVDGLYQHVQKGSREAFASWLALCGDGLRLSLEKFAPLVDVEAVLQEGLLRMWMLAPTVKLQGKDASLRYALRLVRNLAIDEVRRQRHELPVNPGDLDAQFGNPGPSADPSVLQAIRECFGKLPRRPREALLARLRGGADRALADGLDMTINVFLQNIVRARRFMKDCLRLAGVDLGGIA
jgi:DNA-directed RNA polymerase specialized sigma24 family protein